jgi:hypothetical protein
MLLFSDLPNNYRSLRMNNRQLLKEKADTLTEVEISEVLEYIVIMESLRDQRIDPDPLDEIMLRLLSEAVHGVTRRPQRAGEDRATVRH